MSSTTIQRMLGRFTGSAACTDETSASKAVTKYKAIRDKGGLLPR